MMHKKVRALSLMLSLYAVLICADVSAEVIIGEVVSITDGDTIVVLEETKRQYKVRLNGIYAPEKQQPFAQASKKHLSDLVFKKTVLVEWYKKDRHSGYLGKVLVGSVDVGLEQIKAGMAWHYKQYVEYQSPKDRTIYADSEEQARVAQVGIWADSKPVPPWDYRGSKGKGY